MPFFKPRTRAFTLIELLVVMSIVLLLGTLTMTVIGRITGKSRAVKCSNSLRQLGTAAMLYAADNEMTLPATVHQRRQRLKSWTMTLQQYSNGKVTFRCPDDEHKTRVYTYVINDFLTPNPAGAPDIDYSKLARLERPAATVLFTEATEGYANSDHFHFTTYRGFGVPADIFAEQVAVKRHQGAANYVFADGHMETLEWAEARKRLTDERSIFIDPTMAEPTH